MSRDAALPIAFLLAALSISGIAVPSIYVHETPAWTAQAVGQDWFDLVIAAPWLVACGIGARSGSYRWSILLAGAYAYVIYGLLIYAFAVHFNALFLVYCATLGLASYALIGLVAALEPHPVPRRAAHVAGGVLVAIGVLFGALWLVEIVPALVAGTPSQALVETGLFTNPVHVIDLSFVLPAHLLAGVWLWRGHRKGRLYGPLLLAFGVLMAASIGGMLVAIGEGPLGAILFAVAAVSAVLLARVLAVPGFHLKRT